MTSKHQVTPPRRTGAFTCLAPWSPTTVPAGQALARCRRCIKCVELRRYQWVLRAAREQMRHSHTYYLTLTFGPWARRQVLLAASLADIDATAVGKMAQASGPLVTRFVKRCRKAGLEMRYLFVCEPHKNGFPHWHGIVHTWPKPFLAEDPEWDICVLSRCWRDGFHKIEVVNSIGAIRYVTKYITKETRHRVRASLSYGADAT